MPYANNKGADQPVHLRSLISTFVVHCLDSIVSLVSISKISSLYLALVASQAGWVLPVENPEDRFSRDKAHIIPENKLLWHKSTHFLINPSRFLMWNTASFCDLSNILVAAASLDFSISICNK